MRAAAPFLFDRSWRLPLRPEELWAVLSRTDDYPGWWPWLDGFSVDGLHEGAVARFTVRPPLPYHLDLVATVGPIEPARRVEAVIEGDLEGPARLELAEVGSGATEARLVWSVEVRRPLLVRLERVARPALAWAHDLVVGTAARQFQRRALGL